MIWQSNNQQCKVETTGLSDDETYTKQAKHGSDSEAQEFLPSEPAIDSDDDQQELEDGVHEVNGILDKKVPASLLWCY